jgi:hypothetical protein
MMTKAYPLLIEFVPGTRVYRQPDFVSKLPILRNGPPGTAVVFADGTKVNLPTDQIVSEVTDGVARVGFGGMSAAGPRWSTGTGCATCSRRSSVAGAATDDPRPAW